MNSTMIEPTYDDVLAALPRVHAVLSPTLLRRWPGLASHLGCELYLKHENHQPVGAFKVRGGINLVGTLSAEERAAGIICVSTGNHGQSLAFAAQHFGVRCTVVVPVGNNPGKNRAIRELGAELIEHGRDFDEAKAYVEELQRERGGRYVHSANEPLLIAGVGTMAWEIFERFPEPDVLVVPVGLGSGVCGASIVAKHRRPGTEVIGVQAERAAAVARSWRSGECVREATAETWAEGVATRVPAELTLSIMRRLTDDMLLVTEEQMREAAGLILKYTHNLAEGAGAAAVAAVLANPDRFRGRRVVAILSGGNLDLAQLPRILPYAA
jgi:threonine dehydratase